jgi:hypothetical protein
MSQLRQTPQVMMAQYSGGVRLADTPTEKGRGSMFRKALIALLPAAMTLLFVLAANAAADNPGAALGQAAFQTAFAPFARSIAPCGRCLDGGDNHVAENQRPQGAMLRQQRVVLCGDHRLPDRNLASDDAQRLSGRDSAQVAVELDSGFMEKQYRIEDAGCLIVWTVGMAPVNAGILRNRSRCGLSLTEQLPLLSKVLAVVVAGEDTQSLRTLMWGRLLPDSGPSDMDMSFRLALAAHGSPEWDAKRGRPKLGDPNGFVKHLINEAQIHAELIEVFKASPFRIECSGVEKVLVFDASKLPYFGRLEPLGVKRTEKLPFDCLTYFSLIQADKQP